MLVVGIDGCRKGWFAVILENGEWRTELFRTDDFESVRKLCHISELILIDMPIGLPEKGERLCDVEARRILGKRRMSVFPVPCRDAVYAGGYEEAVRINLKVSGRRVSKQLWNISPKIMAIDGFLRENRWARKVLRESHPEICFWSLSGRPMEHSKREEIGIEERLKVIESFFPDARSLYSMALEEYPRSEVGRDDVVDAMVMAVSAELATKYGMKCIPENPELDSEGLEMGMFYGALP